jgi:hypothetical protein
MTESTHDEQLRRMGLQRKPPAPQGPRTYSEIAAAIYPELAQLQAHNEGRRHGRTEVQQGNAWAAAQRKETK